MKFFKTYLPVGEFNPLDYVSSLYNGLEGNEQLYFNMVWQSIFSQLEAEININLSEECKFLARRVFSTFLGFFGYMLSEYEDAVKMFFQFMQVFELLCKKDKVFRTLAKFYYDLSVGIFINENGERVKKTTIDYIPPKRELTTPLNRSGSSAIFYFSKNPEVRKAIRKVLNLFFNEILRKDRESNYWYDYAIYTNRSSGSTQCFQFYDEENLNDGIFEFVFIGEVTPYVYHSYQVFNTSFPFIMWSRPRLEKQLIDYWYTYSLRRTNIQGIRHCPYIGEQYKYYPYYQYPYGYNYSSYYSDDLSPDFNYMMLISQQSRNHRFCFLDDLFVSGDNVTYFGGFTGFRYWEWDYERGPVRVSGDSQVIIPIEYNEE